MRKKRRQQGWQVVAVALIRRLEVPSDHPGAWLPVAVSQQDGATSREQAGAMLPCKPVTQRPVQGAATSAADWRVRHPQAVSHHATTSYTE